MIISRLPQIYIYNIYISSIIGYKKQYINTDDIGKLESLVDIPIYTFYGGIAGICSPILFPAFLIYQIKILIK